MSTVNEGELMTRAGEAGLVPTDQLMAETLGLMGEARASATRAAYERAWAQFTAFCQSQGVSALPASAQTVAIYLTYLAAHQHRALSTIRRQVAVISLMHQSQGHPPVLLRYEPLRTVWRGIVKQHGRPPVRATPIRPSDLARMVATCDDTPAGLRDRAVLLLGFATSFRRSELVRLTVADIEEDPDGLFITRGKSKTDAVGGHVVWVPRGAHPATCPVAAYYAWVQAAGITEGPIFRGLTKHGGPRRHALSDRAVAEIVKRRAELAGLTAVAWEGHRARRYSGHSLRAGFITSAREQNVPVDEIMAHTGHRSAQTLQVYVRRGSIRKSNVAGRLGL